MKTVTKIESIEHFNHAWPEYSAYYVDGLRERARARGIRFTIANGRPPPGFPEMEARDWPTIDNMGGVSLFRAVAGGESFYFCVDGRDRAHEFVPGALAGCRTYFKVNYNEAAILGSNLPAAQRARILPALPFFAIRPRGLAAFVPRLLPGADGWEAVLRQNRLRLRCLRHAPSLKRIRALRMTRKRHDVVFVVPFYDQDWHRESNDFRFETMRALRALPGVDAVLGFVGASVPGRYARFHVPRVSLTEHLQRMASARVLVYVRGVHDCVSFKFGEMLSLGVPVVGQRLLNGSPALMRLPALEQQYAHDDPAAIARGVLELLRDPLRLQALGASNAHTFDRYLAPEAVADECIDALEKQVAGPPAIGSAVDRPAVRPPGLASPVRRDPATAPGDMATSRPAPP